jgi:hypothetical protein
VNVVPDPVVQLVPLLILYSQVVAPVASVTVTVPLFVVPEGNDTLGAEGAVVSITMVCEADATETFPAGSVAFAVIV